MDFNFQRIETKGAPISFNGEIVVGVFETYIREPKIFRAEVLRSTGSMPQAVTVSLRGGFIYPGKHKKPVECWFDGQPGYMEVKLAPNPKKATRLVLWNMWQFENSCLAWFGNSGMIVEEVSGAKDEWIARCSNGVGEPDFEDFVIHFWLLDVTPELDEPYILEQTNNLRSR